MAVFALFIETIDGIAYFAIAIFIFLHLSDIIAEFNLQMQQNSD